MLFPSQSIREERRKFVEAVQADAVDVAQAAERLVARDPDFGLAYLLAGNARSNVGDRDGAEAWMWRGLERQPLQPTMYLALASTRTDLDPQDAFAAALHHLAIAKMGTLTEIPPDISESFRRVAGPKTPTEADFDDPATYQMLATFLEIQAKKTRQPVEVRDQMLPYTLLTRVQEQAPSVFDSTVLQDILDNAPRCAPIFHAALKEWARVDGIADDTTIAFLIAILAEIGDSSLIGDLLEVVMLAPTLLFSHANWAVCRLAQRYPETALAQFKLASAGASLPLRCALAEHIGLLPETPEAKVALLDLLDGFSQFSKKDDGPYLLLAVSDALAEHGEEQSAEGVLAEFEPLLSLKGRRWMRKVASSEAGFVPRLVQEELDQLTIDDICLERILLDDVEDESDEEWDAEEDSHPLASGPPLVKPGRNDPCWCGSGKKYKKCHLDEDQGRTPLELVQPVQQQSGPTHPVVGDPDIKRLYNEVLEFAHKRRNKADFLEATRLYFDKHATDLNPDEIESGDFFEWYIHDYRAKSIGVTAVEEYLQRNRSRLTARDHEILEAWRNGRYGLFEVIRIVEGEGVEITDYFSGETIFVHDISSSRSLTQWDYVLMRVESYKERNLFGSTGIVVQRNMLPQLLEVINKERKPLHQSATDFVRANSHRLPRIVRGLHERWLRELKVVNAEGDELCWSSSVYTMLDEAAVLTALRSIPEFLEDETADGRREFRWLEDTSADSTRSYGAVVIQDDRIRLECNSRPRLARGRKLIEDKAGENIRHMGDTFQSLESVKRQVADKPAIAAPKSDIPPEVQSEILLKYKEQHYAKWPDEPLPALRGKTPREALKTKAGRKAVEELLRTLENSERRAHPSGESAFSFSKLRETLGL